MMSKNYQRRFLRAPLREIILYADGDYVLSAKALNISEGGILLDQIPSFPVSDDVPLMISLPQYPVFKNFSILKLQTFSRELFPHHVVRVKARMVRKDELSQNLDNIFRSHFGLQFLRIMPQDQKRVEEYVFTYSTNLIYLQTLIDSFNTDEETKLRARALAKIMGYRDIDKIADLRARVGHDYKSLQWL